MDTLCEGLDAFESETCAHPVLEVVEHYPGAAPRRPARAPAAHHDGAAVIRVAMVGVPRWARRVRVVPAIALLLWTAAGISVGTAHVLSQRLPEPIPAPKPAVARPAGAPTLVTVVEAMPKEPVKE